MSQVAENIARVRERIAEAAVHAARRPEDVLLVAVSKTHPAERIREAMAAGLRHFGENRVQEAREKIPLMPGGITWHLIGHLQTNKAKYCPELFAWIHSVDSPELARELGRRYLAAGRRARVLLEVNVGGEEQKSGCGQEEAEPLLEEVLRVEGLEPVGLMTLPPYTADPEGERPFYAALRELRDRLAAKGYPREALKELSMGMTHDFAVAIEEGATIIRVGTAIFGERI